MNIDPQTIDTEHFRVHYSLSGIDQVPLKDSDGNGHPDYVEEVAKALEYSWYAEVDYFGWSAPPPDSGLGGDDRYDIYLKDIWNEIAAGYTAPDRDSEPGDNPNTPDVEEESADASYIVLDNDYAEYAADPEPDIDNIEFMRTVVAHELNHALQFGYDSEEPHNWLWEASATWMEDQVFDSVNETRRVLFAVFKSPDSCQLATGGQDRVEDIYHWYGMWVYLRFLSERYGPEAVRQIWELAIDHDSYEPWDLFFKEHGTSVEAFFQDYNMALLTRDFEEGDSYPVLRLEGEVGIDDLFVPVDGVEQMSADFIEIKGDGNLTAHLDAEDMQGLLVGIQGSEAHLIPMENGQVSFDADAYEHSYLVVMNLNRPNGEGNCHQIDYKVRVSEGGTPGKAQIVPISANFEVPEVEGLQDPEEYYRQ